MYTKYDNILNRITHNDEYFFFEIVTIFILLHFFFFDFILPNSNKDT